MVDALDKKRLRDFLMKYKDTWVSQKILSSQLGLPRWSAIINELRSDGYTIAQRMSTDATPLVEYKLSTVKVDTIVGWVCSACRDVIPQERMVSNTLSPKHATGYCTQCRKKATYELKGVPR